MEPCAVEEPAELHKMSVFAALESTKAKKPVLLFVVSIPTLHQNVALGRCLRTAYPVSIRYPYLAACE